MTPYDNLEDLLEEVDTLFPEEAQPRELPPKKPNDEVLMVYRNLSCGQDTPSSTMGPPIPARNGDRSRKKAPLPGGVIPAYNADVRRLRNTGEMAETDVEELLNGPEPPRKRKSGCGCLLILLALLALAGYFLWQRGGF